MRIDQIMAGYADGDAISNMAAQMRAIFREWGYQSDIFADPANISPSLRGDAFALSDYQGGSRDICFHHYGIMSPAAERFIQSSARRIMIYHNITPPSWFKGFDDALAGRLLKALEALPRLASEIDDIWTVSNFNASELARMGIAEAKLLPLPFTPPPNKTAASPLNYNEPLTNLLFVGRIAPNKRIEDLIEAFAWYHLTINRQSRLFIVGSVWSCPRYYSMLRMLVGDLDIENVCFEGFVTDDQLPEYYRLADLYVSASQHEGYCLPLVEAMYHRLPVVARATGGTPEAMDGAGLLYDNLDNAELAALFDSLLTDAKLRTEILDAQEARIVRAMSRNLGGEIRRLLEGMI